MNNHTLITRTGFSLIEMVTVVLIIGILSAVAVPKVYDSMDAYRLKLAAETIAGDLKYARQQAISRSQSITVSFDLINESYTISDIQDRNHPDQTYAVSLTDTPSPADIVSVSSTPAAVITFNQYGIPVSEAIVTLDVSGSQKTVIVHASSGRVSIP
ncbi:GspH/FimT family pseudopilin [Rubinisphaera sp.]|uniref:GspH/FimT family pseudopilin n=1 Tax=Rubinisphaera sp. TaxID=2024857 RepID=UPI000C0F73B0|nr:GspH/FimT family pseudopilin [Rubinisphaera sp.]MBV10646.1 hypothetical protein [Rubinisphaera sp.]HCS52309.1 hypothetical protein [Planctomycetaceae bacterium]|tara:strand:- start:2378 stop:2848 length:471 start_codon:yes stop_codon:yes gene_type:complete